MRWQLLVVGLGACGGSVIVDDPGSSGETTTTTTSATRPVCSSQACDSGGSGCSCQAECAGVVYRVSCEVNKTDGSMGCTCFADELLVAPCNDDAASACDVSGGCCADFFW